MNLKTLAHHPHLPYFQTPNKKFDRKFILPTISYRILNCKKNGKITHCITPIRGLQNAESISQVPNEEEEEEEIVEKMQFIEESAGTQREEFAEKESLWSQMVEIVKFSGPAVGLWICGPLMSLIDTAVIGQVSSIELAALGPGTVFCDNTSYVFMFLSIATSNMVATSLARQDKDEVQHQISILLFIGLASGFLMLFFTRCYGPSALTAFTGANNAEIIAAANTYVQIRGLAWPAVLIGWVAQSARSTPAIYRLIC